MAISYFRPYPKIRRDTHWWLSKVNPVCEAGEIIIVTNIPGWWRRRKTRIKIGDGKTPFNKLRYV